MLPKDHYATWFGDSHANRRGIQSFLYTAYFSSLRTHGRPFPTNFSSSWSTLHEEKNSAKIYHSNTICRLLVIWIGLKHEGQKSIFRTRTLQLDKKQKWLLVWPRSMIIGILLTVKKTFPRLSSTSKTKKSDVAHFQRVSSIIIHSLEQFLIGFVSKTKSDDLYHIWNQQTEWLDERQPNIYAQLIHMLIRWLRRLQKGAS